MNKFSLFLFVFFVSLAISVCGACFYSGSVLLFGFFSVIYFFLLLSAIFFKVSYGYMFFSVMLWLGFWLKVIVHLIFDYPFVEPIGYFDGSSQSWDGVLLLASIGALGVLVGRLICHGFFGSFSALEMSTKFSPPGWYVKNKLPIWLTFIVLLAAFSILNLYFSFQQVGIVPKFVVWPLNALFYWLLSSGFVMTLVTMLWWEYLSGGNRNTVYFIFIESAVSTISLLSRGVYIFHSVPVLFSIFLCRKKLEWFGCRWFLGLLCSFVFFFFVCYPLVNSARNHYYSPESSAPFAKPAEYYGELLHSKALMKIVMFSVDRWVGAEGLMATYAYPDKGGSLFFSVLIEKGEIGKLSTFQEIAQSHYREIDASRFSFASLPGPTSFFYLSGSPWVVMFGMVILTLLVITSELFVHKLLYNPLLSAYWGGFVSSAFSQMGVNVPGFAFYFFLCILGVVFLYFVKEYFSVIASMLKSNKFGRRNL